MASHLHCVYCFDSIAEKLLGLDKDPEPKFENASFPLFVTWNIKRGECLSLRGCIGSFSSLDLYSGLNSYAQLSAFKDTRFDPISKQELQHLQVGVSLLTDFEQASSWNDFEIGKHGIRIKFERYSGMIHIVIF